MTMRGSLAARMAGGIGLPGATPLQQPTCPAASGVLGARTEGRGVYSISLRPYDRKLHVREVMQRSQRGRLREQEGGRGSYFGACQGVKGMAGR